MSKIQTASSLFLGKINSGNYKCYYCGVNCHNEYNIQEYVKKTFTNHEIVFCPDSEYVCQGCVAAMGSKTKIKMVNGEIRIGSPRLYSWVVTESSRIAYSKSHIWEMKYGKRNIILERFCLH